MREHRIKNSWEIPAWKDAVKPIGGLRVLVGDSEDVDSDMVFVYDGKESRSYLELPFSPTQFSQPEDVSVTMTRRILRLLVARIRELEESSESFLALARDQSAIIRNLTGRDNTD